MDPVDAERNGEAENEDEENFMIEMAEEDDDDEDDEHDEDDDGTTLRDQIDEQCDASSRHEETEKTTTTEELDSSEELEGRKQSSRLEALQPDDLIWFDPKLLGFCIPGKVVENYAGRELHLLTVEGLEQHESGNDYSSDENRPLESNGKLQLYELSDKLQLATVKRREPLEEVRGLTDLVELREQSLEAIMYNLKLRHQHELVYTKCGHKILISLNPFKQLAELYELSQVQHFDTATQNCYKLAKRGQQAPSSLVRWLLVNLPQLITQNKSNCEEAHIFSFANSMLSQLLVSGNPQSLILMGESGSGKSEAAKLLVQYLAAVDKSQSNLISEQILESVQLLESFGNAKTILNDNSSRFARILELRIELDGAFIRDSRIKDLNLLDRSRILMQNEGERNYHIFYELLAGLSKREREKYGLLDAEKYFYLNQGRCVHLDSKDDADDFRSLLASMQVLGFTYQEQDSLFRLLASILHLGNVYFHRRILAVRSASLASQPDQQHQQTSASSSGIEGVEIGSDTEIRWISHLLEIQFESVVKCLTMRTAEGPGGERVLAPLNIDQALDTRDALARALYTYLFKWLIERLNSTVSSTGVRCRAERSHGSQGSLNDEFEESLSADEAQNQAPEVEDPIYLCHTTSESLCEFEPTKLSNQLGFGHSTTTMSSNENIYGDSIQSSVPRSATLAASEWSTSAAGSRRQQQGQQATMQPVKRNLLASVFILDAFGFESLSENNFEQLCINYTAELLQFHTNRYLVRLEQAEYARERLTLKLNIDAQINNSPQIMPISTEREAQGSQAAAIVNLIGRKPLGLLALLDDECNFPKATDVSFLEKCHHNHALNEQYSRSRAQDQKSSRPLEFGIRHFRQASKLTWYSAEGFVEKNRDSLRSELVELLSSSNIAILNEMTQKLIPNQRQAHDLGRFSSMKPRASTVSAKFLDSLHHNAVLESLRGQQATSQVSNNLRVSNNESSRKQDQQQPHQASPWFVLCMKPNKWKSSQSFDVAYVQEQARSLNLSELVAIRRSGFPVRLRYSEFVRRYSSLIPRKFLENQNQLNVTSTKRQASRDAATSIVMYQFQIESLKQSWPPNWPHSALFQCGLTRLFLNERLYHQLESLRLRKHLEAVQVMQRSLKMWPERRRFLEKRHAVILMQALVRGHLARCQFWYEYSLIVALQRRWREQLRLRRHQKLELKRRAQRKQQLKMMQEIQSLHGPNQAARFRQDVLSASPANIKQQLDIPSDLIHLYRCQREWPPVHKLDQIVDFRPLELLKREQRRLSINISAPFLVAQQWILREPNEHRLKLANLLESDQFNSSYSLKRFLTDFYTHESPQFGYSRLPINRPFAWPRMIRSRAKELERHVGELSEIEMRWLSIKDKSLAMYKLLLRYIDSNQEQLRLLADADLTTASEHQLNALTERLLKFKLIVDYLMALCLSEIHLRDEIYLQLVSLSWQNPRASSRENVWKLMLNCASCFAPHSKKLTCYLLKHCNDYASDRYREPLIERLAVYLNMKDQQPVHEARRFPITLLEYVANERAVEQLAVSISTYMDDEDAALDLEANQIDFADIEATNHSAKTLVKLLPSENLAEQVARNVLEARQVPAQNLFGWSIEIQQESAPSDPSWRLKGDESLLDQLARLELLPGLLELIERQSNLDCCLPSDANNNDGNHLNLPKYQPQNLLDKGAHYAPGSLSRYPLSRPPSKLYNSRAQAGRIRRNSSSCAWNENRLSTGSCQYGGSAQYAPGSLYRSSQHQQHEASASNRYSSLMNRNRRSMSMQELQLGQYITSNRVSSQLAYNYDYPKQYGRLSSNSTARGSLQQLNRAQQAQIYSGTNSETPYGELGAAQRSSLLHRKRLSGSGLPSSSRLSSSAYGSDSARNQSPFRQPVEQSYDRAEVQRSPRNKFQPKLAKQRATSRPFSSAMSDTSEAPSLASHVRKIRVPQQADADLDQYLDDLFNPMLNECDQLDVSGDEDCDVGSELGAQSGDDGDESGAISPTFDSLIRGMQSQSQASRDLVETPSSTNMDLEQLKALNDQLERQIEASKSNSKLDLDLSDSKAPIPPPLPSFNQSEASKVVAATSQESKVVSKTQDVMSEMRLKLERQFSASENIQVVEGVRPLAEQRRKLLEGQLLTGDSSRNSASTRRELERLSAELSAGGGKVLEAKHRLAAAAGFALSALDATKGSSRPNSLAQSEEVERISGGGLKLADELGPQQRSNLDHQRQESSQRSIQSSSSKLKRSIGIAQAEVSGGRWVSSSPQQASTSAEFKNALGNRNSQLQRPNRPLSSRSLGSRKSMIAELRASRRRKKSHPNSSEHHQAQEIREVLPNEDCVCLAYGNVDWQLKLRKELFMPIESYDEPVVIQLIFCQLVADVFNPRQWTRLNNKERAAMKSLMKDNAIGYAASLPKLHEMGAVKRDLVRMARSFGLYFTRSYGASNYALLDPETRLLDFNQATEKDTVANQRFELIHSEIHQSIARMLSDFGLIYESLDLSEGVEQLCDALQTRNSLGLHWIHMVAIHHSGLRLVAALTRATAAEQSPAASSDSSSTPTYKVLETVKFRDMGQVLLLTRNHLFVGARNGKQSWILHSNEAPQISTLLKRFQHNYAGFSDEGGAGCEQLACDQPSRETSQQKAGEFKQAKIGTKLRKQEKRSNSANRNAALASADDNHGDRFEEREASHYLSKPSRMPSANNAPICPKPVNSAHPSKLGAFSSPSGGSGEDLKKGKKNMTFGGNKLQQVSGSSGSLWQSSLSRMSNKLAIFSSNNNNNNATIQETKQDKQKRRLQKGQDSGRRSANGSSLGDSGTLDSSVQLALDSWIESKLEFGQDEAEINEHPEAGVSKSQDGGQLEQQAELNNSADTTSLASTLASKGTNFEQKISNLSTTSQREDDDGKYSLLQFALHNFREALSKYSLNGNNHSAGDTSTLRGSLKLLETLRGSRNGSSLGGSGGEARGNADSRQSNEWTWRELAQMVKFTPLPLKESLLRLPNEELNRRALDCNSAILQYMGDLKANKSAGGKTTLLAGGEIECVYLILMNLHNYQALRDEVYCQLIKQTTNNRSQCEDSCLRGWRLFSIVAAYFACSDHFKPYLLKYLETAAYDKRRAYCSVALLCLQNLRKTFKYQGRKNVPSVEEIAATSAGRNSKRQIYRLPGGTERVINTKSSTVVDDIIYEICANMLNVTEPNEMLEFSLYCIADGDPYTMPLNRDDYILDVTTELIKNHQQYFLIFCRSVWFYPLRLDSQLYIEVIFNQIAPDYLEGLLMQLPTSWAAYPQSGSHHHSGGPGSRSSARSCDSVGSSVGSGGIANQLGDFRMLRGRLVAEIARIAALLHRASGVDRKPQRDELKLLLPKPILAALSYDRTSEKSDGELEQLLQSDAEISIASPSLWLNLVVSNWAEMSTFDALDAKAQLLDLLQTWPLFGSSFFASKLIQQRYLAQGPAELILALNKFGIQMLDLETHQVVHKYHFGDIISTRKVRSEDGALFLDLKCGNLMKRTIVRIQTDQAHEISRLIRQYVDIELLHSQQQQHLQQQQQQQLAP